MIKLSNKINNTGTLQKQTFGDGYSVNRSDVIGPLWLSFLSAILYGKYI